MNGSARMAVLWAAWIGLGAGCGREAPGPAGHRTGSGGENGAAGPGAVSGEISAEILPEVPGRPAPEFGRRLRPLMAKADPEGDGWETETFSAAVAEWLHDWAGALEKAPAVTQEALPAWVAEGVVFSLLRPAALEAVFDDGVVQVLRASGGGVGAADASPGGSGSAALAAALTELLGAFGGAADLSLHFKVTGVERPESGDGPVETTVLYSASGTTAGGEAVQQNAAWRCAWAGGEEDPLLQALRLESFEEIRPGAGGGVRFADQTAALLGDDPSYREQLQRGSGYWTRRLDRHLDIDSTGHQGLALGDVNGDGLEDLYLCQQGGLPNRLYVRAPDGSLREQSREAGVDWMENCHGALLVDLDNDGDQDLAVAGSAAVLLHENDGRGRFAVRLQARAEANYYSLAAADYDADGRLDLYFCGNTPRRGAGEGEGARGGPPVPYHDANNGGRNLLLRNEGEWNFRDATRESGLDANNTRYSFAASWEDFDNDGDPDLYVANDFGRNNLYRNDGGRFTDVAAQAGVEDISAGMSVTWGDADRDGLMDLYVSNMFSSAGNRVTYQRRFRESQGAALPWMRRHARGNSLFRNGGEGTFADVSVAAGVTMARWAWAAQFLDFNNDGWEDLYVANGYITGEDDADL